MKENEIRKQIGKNIKLARNLSNFTQEQLAEKASLSVRYISQIERGLAFGSAETIVSICKSLNITPDFIFNPLIKNDAISVPVTLQENELLRTYLELNKTNQHFIQLMATQLLELQHDTSYDKE